METIDLKSWKRRRHFELFKDYDQPHFSISANVEITDLYYTTKREQRSLFAALLFHVVKCLNMIPEFRTRIRGEEVVIHEIIHPSFTVLDEDGLFGFAATEFADDFNVFCASVKESVAKGRSESSLVDEPGKDDLIYVSTLPWVTFTSLTHPFSTKTPDSIPRVSWGKYYFDNNKVFIPLAVSGHHALCDGVHVGMFYTLLADALTKLG